MTILISFSLSTYASSQRVGDWIILEGSIQGMNSSLKGSYVSFNGSSMLQNTETTLNGSVINSESAYIASDEVITPEVAGLMVAMCADFGGVHEYLNLPVGKTLTCKLQGSNAHLIEEKFSLPLGSLEALGEVLWIGPFPVLGLAKLESGGVTFTIANYHWN